VNTPDTVKTLIVEAVDSAIRQFFPKNYFELCHVYAVVGSNVASILLGHEYRPVAGLAVIDSGAGCFIKLLDNNAFSSGKGGAYHCWIESSHDGAAKELIDIIFKHNRAYARKHKLVWRKKNSTYLWGSFNSLVVNAELDALPKNFSEGQIWVRETLEGTEWMCRHLESYTNPYVEITALALKKLKAHESTG
jgi:hypothetical protein